MTLANLPIDKQKAIREAYFKDVLHLCELGLVELSPDGKGVSVTPKGRACFLQQQHFDNKESEF